MHGMITKKAVTENTKPLGVKPIQEGPNVERTTNGYFTYKEDVNKLYEGNPYFTGISENADNKVTLDKSIPDERLVSNNENYERVCAPGIGAPDWYRRKESLADMYRGNPYYRPAKA